MQKVLKGFTIWRTGVGGDGAMVTAGDCFEGGMASLAMVGSDDSLRQLQRRIERAVRFEIRLE